MKLYKKILFLGTIALPGVWMASCNDDATLENSQEVYIDISPSNIVLSMGDTLAISATVSNTSGKIIDTPIEWSLDDESVVTLLGDSALVCIAGALDRGSTDVYTTKLRASLVNGKYAVAGVMVRPNIPDGVTPDFDTYTSYNTEDDEIWFTVSPKSLLDDYQPVVTLSNDNITLSEPALIVEKEVGRVGVRFTSGRVSGDCVITLTVGEGTDAKSASCTILMQPFVESSLWDPGTGSGPNDIYIRRMVMGELEMYRTFSLTKTIDVNSTSYAYAGVNVPGSNEQDIRQAMQLCKWEAVSGNSVLVTEMRNDYLDQLGFDAVLKVASGAVEGNTVFNFVATDTILEVTFRVIDFKKQPVNAITTNVPADGLEMVVGGRFILETGVEPITSFIYHRPVVTAQDPSIVEVGEYDSNQLPLTGLKEGKTNLVLTANDKTLTIPVTVSEGVSDITFSSSNAKAAFAGQTLTWEAVIVTSSGKANTFPITWSSSNESIAVASAGDNPLANGKISAKSVGVADITATVVGKSVTAPLEVLEVPGDFSYTADNTSNVAVGNNSNNLRILLTGPADESIVILLDGYRGQYDFDVTDMSVVTVSYNNVEIVPESGWLKGEDLGKTTKFSFELNFNIAGKKFKLKATDLEG